METGWNNQQLHICKYTLVCIIYNQVMPSQRVCSKLKKRPNLSTHISVLHYLQV